MYQMLRILFAVSLTALLGGCLLISPYNGQILTSRTQTLPFQAWTISAGDTLRVECMPTNRFGPEVSPHGSWSEIGTVPASDDASRDLSGNLMYSASKSISLPESCWYLNQSNNWYYTSLRVKLSGSSSYFYTVDRDGVGCAAASVADRGVWIGWHQDKCYQQYSGGTGSVLFIVMRTQG